MDVAMTPQPAAPVAGPAVSERAKARRETLRQLLRRPAFIVGNIIIISWIVIAILGERITPRILVGALLVVVGVMLMTLRWR